MPFEEENVYTPITGDDETVPAGGGITPETVNLAGGLTTQITDTLLNVFIGDDRDIYFGNDFDYSIGLNENQDSLDFKDNLLGKNLLNLYSDGSIALDTISSLEKVTSSKGNVALTNSHMYIKVTE
tara:strand:+ start:798 stop:1175 length:378 start_codon:yes stop_codon:yes gene_type:complete